MSDRITRIYTLGPAGTFSHEAAVAAFPGRSDIITLTDRISDVFSRVADDHTATGLVPVENSIRGLVQETLDDLVGSSLTVHGSYEHPVRLHLLANTDALERITVVRSHPQPLAQARAWLDEHLPQAERREEVSSVSAIRETSDPQVAFIGSRQAAEQYGLSVLATDIQGGEGNSTRFYAVSHVGASVPLEALRTERTILLCVIHDRPGVLRDILSAFADRGLNLSRLDSHRTEVPDWDYYFMIEVEATPESEVVQAAFRDVEELCFNFRVLGMA